MKQPRLLDLFCGGGGAALGYHRAGFDVTGVDLHPQPDYPYRFIRCDALIYLAEYGHRFDAVHASPPCQAHTPLSALQKRDRGGYLDLIPDTRSMLSTLTVPWVIENVPYRSAGLINPVILCGQMFDTGVIRHRGFETNWKLRQPAHRPHRRTTRNSYLPTPGAPLMTVTGRNGHHSRAWVAAAALAMGVEHLSINLNAVCEAIPPAYTAYIGSYLMDLM